MSDYNTLQQLMNQAYRKFQPEDTHEEFFDQLDYLERCAVAIGNMNYQVENGGFTQWVDNRYEKSTGNFLVRLLRKMEEKGILELVEAARTYSEQMDAHNGHGHRYGYDFDEPQLEDGVDTRYYELNDRFLERADAWLASRLNVESC